MSAILTVVVATSIYGTSIEDIRRELPYAARDNAIVADAIEREIDCCANGDLGEKSVRENVIPIVVHFADKRCVVLRSPAGSIGGGPPIYCYEKGRDSFLDYYHDGSQ